MTQVAYRQSLCLLAVQMNVCCQPVAAGQVFLYTGKVVLTDRDRGLPCTGGAVMTAPLTAACPRQVIKDRRLGTALLPFAACRRRRSGTTTGRTGGLADTAFVACFA